METKDPTNPKYYRAHPSGIECIVITEHMNFCLGNAIKYLWRAGSKDTDEEIEDLQKAKWYIEREILKLQRQDPKPETLIQQFEKEVKHDKSKEDEYHIHTVMESENLRLERSTKLPPMR